MDWIVTPRPATESPDESDQPQLCAGILVAVIGIVIGCWGAGFLCEHLVIYDCD